MKRIYNETTTVTFAVTWPWNCRNGRRRPNFLKMRLLLHDREILELFILLLCLIFSEGKHHVKNNDGKFWNVYLQAWCQNNFWLTLFIPLLDTEYESRSLQRSLCFKAFFCIKIIRIPVQRFRCTKKIYCWNFLPGRLEEKSNENICQQSVLWKSNFSQTKHIFKIS